MKRFKRSLIVILCTVSITHINALSAGELTTGERWAEPSSDLKGLRDRPIQASPDPDAIPKVVNSDEKKGRSYPMQPPVIPHKIDNYQTDLNANRCLACHKRSRTEASQAPMVSVTHYMNRDGNFLAEISPRRYFCLQCHVTQTETQPAIPSEYVDLYQLLPNSAEAGHDDHTKSAGNAGKESRQ